MTQEYPQISIDRTQPVDSQLLGISTTLEVVSEDPDIAALSTIDFSRVSIKPILDITEEHPSDVVHKMQENIDRLKAEGYVFLDAKVLQALFTDKNQIPKEWIKFADTDAPDTASIEFRGSTFHPSDNPTQEVILNIAFTRGVWDAWYSDAFYSAEALKNFAENGPWGKMVRYAAVLK